MVLCIVIHVMPEYALDWVPGSGICLYQETLYQSVSCRRRLRRTAPCETPGMATQVRLAFHRRYWCSSIACRSTGQQSSAPSPPSQSEQRWGQLLLKVMNYITITLHFLHYHYHYHYTVFRKVIITITITLEM